MNGASGAPHGFAWRSVRVRIVRLAAALLALVFVVAILIFLVQNADPVRVSWLSYRVRAPLWVVSLITATAAGLVAALITWTWGQVQRRPRDHAGRSIGSSHSPD